MKIQIAYKKSREALYWLILISEKSIIEKKLTISMKNDCEELFKILTKIIKSSK
jgi:four helix bundle protein